MLHSRGDGKRFPSVGPGGVVLPRGLRAQDSPLPLSFHLPLWTSCGPQGPSPGLAPAGLHVASHQPVCPSRPAQSAWVPGVRARPPLLCLEALSTASLPASWASLPFASSRALCPRPAVPPASGQVCGWRARGGVSPSPPHLSRFSLHPPALLAEPTCCPHLSARTGASVLT